MRIDWSRTSNREMKGRFVSSSGNIKIGYTLLAFICLKMELQWVSNPAGRLHNSLLFLEKVEDKNLHKKLDSTKPNKYMK